MSPELKERVDKICGAMERTVDMLQRETDEIVALGDHVELIRHYDAARSAQERIKDARKQLEAIIDKMSSEQVPDAMRAKGVKTTFVEGVGRVTIAHRFSCSMLDKQAGFEWLREHGHDGIIQETVNSSTLSAFAKSQIEDGFDLPDDVFKTGTFPYTSITKK